MANDEVQKELLAETKSPEQALNYAVRREKSLENQIYIRKQETTGNQSGFTSVKSEPVNFVQKSGGYKSQPRGGRRQEGMTSINNTDRLSQIKLATNAAMQSQQTTSHSVRLETKFATNVQKGAILPNFASPAK